MAFRHAMRHTGGITLRYLRAVVRQPAWVAISLVQPVIWLLLFGALFKRVADIPGFTGGSYIEFLTPGVVVMIAVLSAGWTGMGFIEDIERGVMDRFLVSPIWRGALNAGSVAGTVISIVVQTLIVIGLALVVGAHFSNGVLGVLALVGVAALLAAVIGSLSNGVAVLMRERESLIGIVSLMTLPLTFLSTSLMQGSLLPGWVRWAAKFNPVNWAAEAGRSAVTQNADWGLIASRVGLLVLLLFVSATFATRAFHAYQRSI
jgi:ABC-2 type transport system permease protein